VGTEQARTFYEREYASNRYAVEHDPNRHAHFAPLRAFVEHYGLADRRCLEVGCGRGAFQELVLDYHGVDIASTLRANFHKPYYQASAIALPFANSTFDALWSINTLEHVPDPEGALSEMRRVLRPNGLLFLAPAWQCRPWAAEGYAVRPFTDFGLRGKLVKASVPIRDSVLFRLLSIFPRRFLRAAAWSLRRGPTRFRFRLLRPNYDHFWISDSDAVNSMDPFEVIRWFVSRGDTCLNYPTLRRQLLVRSGPLIVRAHGSVSNADTT
jgi:SAM-dependent methyltransferase